MGDFFTFLETHSTGIMIFIFMLVAFVIIIRWLFQIFAIGKYSNKKAVNEQETSITYILTRSLVNIVDDFRHFLALLIVILFIVLIIVAMWGAKDGKNDFQNMMDAMQLVIASLGGLLGSIIGYYYGESAARNKIPTSITTDNEEITNDEGGEIVEPVVEEIIEPIVEEIIEPETGAEENE